MKRREFLKASVATGVAASAAGIWTAGHYGWRIPGKVSADSLAKLTPPAQGDINVAIAISEGAQVIDFAGPWEVFQDVMIKDGHNDEGMDHRMPFNLYTVAETKETITGSGGLKLVPDYTFANAPAPKIVVVPAQTGSDALHAWLKKVAADPNTDLVTSVCTGAFQLAKAGLLTGKPATTHHLAQTRLKKDFPTIDVKTGLRFVEDGRIDTAGGLTSGIDMALRIVDRYYGRAIAQQTADFMEYQSKGWMV